MPTLKRREFYSTRLTSLPVCLVKVQQYTFIELRSRTAISQYLIRGFDDVNWSYSKRCDDVDKGLEACLLCHLLMIYDWYPCRYKVSMHDNSESCETMSAWSCGAVAGDRITWTARWFGGGLVRVDLDKGKDILIFDAKKIALCQQVRLLPICQTRMITYIEHTLLVRGFWT